MTPVARIVARRQFSMLQSLRTASRATALPKAPRVAHAPADWAGEAKRVGTQLALFVPGIALLLGWPLLAAKGMDGHI